MNKFQFFLCALFLMSASTFQAVDIFYEISKGNRRSLISWLKSSPDLSICNKLGQSVLHAAVLANSDHMVKIVLTSKVPVNALDKTGKTALDYAVDHCKDLNIAFKLIKQGAKVTTAEKAEFVKTLIQHQHENSGFFFFARKIIGAFWAYMTVGLIVLSVMLFPMMGSLPILDKMMALLINGVFIGAFAYTSSLLISSARAPVFRRESYPLTAISN